MANVEEMFQVALKHHAAGEVTLAEPLYLDILRSDRENSLAPHAHYNLGLIRRAQGRLAEAADCFRQTLAGAPNHADAHNNLGVILMEQGQWHEAAASFHRALQVDGNHAGAWSNLGNALLNLDHRKEAVESFRHALRIDPNQADVLNNLANAFMGQDQENEAIVCYRQALAISPQNINASYNLGMALYLQRELSEAEACFRHALALDPGHQQARWNRSLIRLVRGEFEDAWPEFEARWALPGLTPRVFQKPRWDGSPLHGKTVYIYPERGLGDTIQFIRYVRLVKGRGGRVVFECPPVLAGVLARVDGIDHLAIEGQLPPAFDVHVPLLSLPGIFRTTLASISKANPYLTADSALVERWSAEFKVACGSPLNIGIVWQGSPAQWQDRKRSVPLAQFAQLARHPRVRLFSLQVGPGREQLTQTPFALADLAGRFDARSFDDLAAVMMNLDLVVTVDTAAAHLAGALGVPVWVALPYTACWRWLLDRSDSPWYPTMRLFRQKQPGDWGEMFKGIVKEIDQLGSANRG